MDYNSDTFLGIRKNTWYGILLLLLLLILGILTFNYYFYLNGDNGFRAGTGFNIALFPNLNPGFQSYRGPYATQQAMQRVAQTAPLAQ